MISLILTAFAIPITMMVMYSHWSYYRYRFDPTGDYCWTVGYSDASKRYSLVKLELLYGSCNRTGYNDIPPFQKGSADMVKIVKIYDLYDISITYERTFIVDDSSDFDIYCEEGDLIYIGYPSIDYFKSLDAARSYPWNIPNRDMTDVPIPKILYKYDFDTGKINTKLTYNDNKLESVRDYNTNTYYDKKNNMYTRYNKKGDIVSRGKVLNTDEGLIATGLWKIRIKNLRDNGYHYGYVDCDNHPDIIIP
jgi:hypothetical protein